MYYFPGNNMAAEAFAGSSFWSNVGPNYTWPRGSKTEESEYIMYGRMDRLPPTPSKTARIFLSSTFTDTYAERNLLIKSVYPKLKKICKERFDLDFQVSIVLVQEGMNSTSPKLLQIYSISFPWMQFSLINFIHIFNVTRITI